MALVFDCQFDGYCIRVVRTLVMFVSPVWRAWTNVRSVL